MEQIVRLDNVTRLYGADDEIVALEDVSIEINSGTFVAVMGATGSGKSTLLNVAAGLERTSAGTVRLVDKEISRMGERAVTRLRRDHVGFVFQSYNLLSELTVAQNVMLPRRLGAGRGRPLTEVLADVGLDGMEDRPIGALSGGQRQRVAVARALSTGAAVIFADEPTGALDPTTGAQLMALLRDAVDRHGVTVVMVTHDPLTAVVSDRLVMLRAGRIVDDRATPDVPAIATRLRAVSQLTAVATSSIEATS